MESRNITLTLDKAQEFYNSGNTALREIALQAFTEDELQGKDFKKFKSWKDIEDDLADRGVNFYRDTKCLTKGQIALLKLNHIRKILNNDQKMSLTKGAIYYPYIRFTTKASKYYKDELKSGSLVKVGTIEQSCGDLYYVLGGDTNSSGSAGLGCFYSNPGVGTFTACFGFLGCVSQEIAEHMSRYFAKEIFDAMYGDFVDYKWVE